MKGLFGPPRPRAFPLPLREVDQEVGKLATADDSPRLGLPVPTGSSPPPAGGDQGVRVFTNGTLTFPPSPVKGEGGYDGLPATKRDSAGSSPHRGQTFQRSTGAAQTSTGGFSSSRPMDFQTISAMSRAAMLSSFLRSLIPSDSMVRQKGQPTAIFSAPVAMA